MSVLSKPTLLKRLHELIEIPNPQLVNSASIDFRVGSTIQIEIPNAFGTVWSLPTDIRFGYDERHPYWIRPGEFVLVATMESFKVPLDLVMEMRLKSSRAREGYDHSLAFWFDPGWVGVGTMEIKNNSQYSSIPLYPGLKIGQVIFHTLDIALTPEEAYAGKYQGATTVQASKDKE